MECYEPVNYIVTTPTGSPTSERTMSSILWKSFNLCFSKFKCLPTIHFSPPFTDQQEDDNLCHQKSLTSTSTAASAMDDFSSADTDPIPDFASVFASQRFFFSTPGSSNSIFEPTKVEVPGTFLSGGVAVQTNSSDPYADFRNSMQEMIEAHEMMDVQSRWEFLHELLSCYLSLNPKHTHKFIVDAFADVIISLATHPETCREARSRQHRTAPWPVA